MRQTLKSVIQRPRAAGILPILCAMVALSSVPRLVAQDLPNSVADADKPQLTADQVVARLQERNHEREVELRKFHGTRVYRVQYNGFFGERKAEAVVDYDYTSPNDKQFLVVSRTGSKVIFDRVIKGLLNGEREASSGNNHEKTAVSPENYDFTLLDTDTSHDRPQYVLNVVPKTDYKYLYRGKIWVDAKDFAVTRIEAEPAKNPSFWITKTKVHHEYEKVGDFWLPAENNTESSIRLGGHALLSIEYEDYKITETAPSESAEAMR